MQFQSTSIASRLALGFGAVLALLLATAGVSGYEVLRGGARLEQIAKVNNVKTELANDMMARISDMAIQARNSALFTDVSKIDGETKQLLETQKDYLKIEALLAKEIAKPTSSKDERDLWQAIIDARDATMPLVKEAAQRGSEGDTVSSVMILTSKVAPAEAHWREMVGKLIELQKDQSAQAMQDAADGQRRTLVIQAALVSSALLAGAAIGWRITRSVTRPVRRAVRVAERIAQGDLSATIETHAQDETGRLLMAMCTMQQQLRGLVGDIRGSADSIKQLSAEVASGNLDLSTRTEETANQLQQTATSVANLADAVGHSSAAARQAQLRATGASEVAARGGAVVSRVVETMEAINSSAKQITEIIAVIDGIAFQTNILALNAAVEASRAGEQGRGFAVVASEVRSLAARSADAAKQIKVLITASVKQVGDGSVLVTEAGRTMTDIVASVHSVTDMINSITEAAARQTHDIDQVNSSIHHLDEMTQQNSAMVEESAAATAMLAGQSDRLADLVHVFVTDEGQADEVLNCVEVIEAKPVALAA